MSVCVFLTNTFKSPSLPVHQNFFKFLFFLPTSQFKTIPSASPLQHRSLSPRHPIIATYSSAGKFRALYIRFHFFFPWDVRCGNGNVITLKHINTRSHSPMQRAFCKCHTGAEQLPTVTFIHQCEKSAERPASSVYHTVTVCKVRPG